LISNFGTPSATGITNCVPSTIIETVMGMSGLLLLWLGSIVAHALGTASYFLLL
jgi:hypothetical protein